jgi:hypothetical protein
MKARIGIARSGYIARVLFVALQGQADLGVSCVLTRTDPSRREDFPQPELLTTFVDEITDSSDLVVECNGDVLHATAIVDAALRAALPVVTMDAEMQAGRRRTACPHERTSRGDPPVRDGHYGNTAGRCRTQSAKLTLRAI